MRQKEEERMSTKNFRMINQSHLLWKNQKKKRTMGNPKRSKQKYKKFVQEVPTSASRRQLLRSTSSKYINRRDISNTMWTISRGRARVRLSGPRLSCARSI